MSVVRRNSRGPIDPDARAARPSAVTEADEIGDGPEAPPDAPSGTRLMPAHGVVAEPQESAALPPVLTVDELAGLLRVERKTAYAAIARGEIPGVRRLGGVIRVSRDTVLAWLSQGQGRVSRSRRPS